MTELPNRAYVTPAEVAKFLAVDESTVRRWARNGEIPAIKVGGATRINRESFLASLAKKPADSEISLANSGRAGG